MRRQGRRAADKRTPAVNRTDTVPASRAGNVMSATWRGEETKVTEENRRITAKEAWMKVAEEAGTKAAVFCETGMRAASANTAICPASRRLHGTTEICGEKPVVVKSNRKRMK